MYTEPNNPNDPDRLKFLALLKETKGNISKACEAFPMSRMTYYDWMKEDWFKEKVEEINESIIDHVESKLHEKINGVTVQTFDSQGLPVIYTVPPSDRAITFFLSTKGRKRGYQENKQVDIQTPIIVNSQSPYSQEELDKSQKIE